MQPISCKVEDLLNLELIKMINSRLNKLCSFFVFTTLQSPKATHGRGLVRGVVLA